MADAAGAKEPPGAILRPAAPKLDGKTGHGKTAPSTRQGSPRKLSAPRHHKSLDARRGTADGDLGGRAPRAGALMKCCCPPCAVYMHEGPGVPRGPAWRAVFLDERSGGSPASTRVERRPGDAASCKRRPARAGASPLSAWGPGTRCCAGSPRAPTTNGAVVCIRGPPGPRSSRPSFVLEATSTKNWRPLPLLRGLGSLTMMVVSGSFLGREGPQKSTPYPGLAQVKWIFSQVK